VFAGKRIFTGMILKETRLKQLNDVSTIRHRNTTVRIVQEQTTEIISFVSNKQCC